MSTKTFSTQEITENNGREEAPRNRLIIASRMSPVDQVRDRMRDYEWQNALSKSLFCKLPITRCQSQHVPCLKTRRPYLRCDFMT